MSSDLRRIRRLAPELANQIAAGEVVERPASVVKELVENALDAGADNIVVEAEEAGVRLLRVRDNGGGIHHDDLALALSRHATSKIGHTRDLLGITSLGFRGEALASIASVTRLRLTSRARDAENGWSVESEEQAPAPAAHPVGTTVEARDLFYNVPARRKFLRAERTEYEHLEEVVRRLALSKFDCGFTLRHNGRTAFTLAPALDTAARERRVSALLGRPFLEHAVAMDFTAAGLRLHGWIGVNGYTRSQSDVQYVYLNGRMIRDRVVAHALRQAFGDAVPEGRFAAWLLYFEVDPAQVDVNVHPTKHEVRFREARLVHDFLVSAVRGALGGGVWSDEPVVAPSIREAPVAYAPLPAEPAPRAFARETETGERILGLKSDRFLIAESGEGLVVVDALRLVQQQAREALAGRALRVRPLLIPVTARVGAAGVREAEAMAERLRSLGVDLQPVSADAVRVHGLPDVETLFDPARLAAAVLAAGAAARDEELLECMAGAARVPADRREWPALLARAREQRCCLVQLDESGLEELFRGRT